MNSDMSYIADVGHLHTEISVLQGLLAIETARANSAVKMWTDTEAVRQHTYQNLVKVSAYLTDTQLADCGIDEQGIEALDLARHQAEIKDMF